MDDAAGAEERYALIPEQHQVHAVFQGHQGAGRHGDRQVEHAVPGECERQFGEHALQRRGREPERELVAQQHLGRAAHQVHIDRGSGLTQDDDGQCAGEIPQRVQDAGQSGQDAADDRGQPCVGEVEQPEHQSAGHAQRGAHGDVVPILQRQRRSAARPPEDGDDNPAGPEASLRADMSAMSDVFPTAGMV